MKIILTGAAFAALTAQRADNLRLLLVCLAPSTLWLGASWMLPDHANVHPLVALRTHAGDLADGS